MKENIIYYKKTDRSLFEWGITIPQAYEAFTSFARREGFSPSISSFARVVGGRGGNNMRRN
jgi:hypothetical protein